MSSNEDTLENYRVQIKLAYNNYIEHVSLNWHKISVENRSIIEERITNFQSRVGIAYSKLNTILLMFNNCFDKLEYTINPEGTSTTEKNRLAMESTNFLKLASSTIKKILKASLAN